MKLENVVKKAGMSLGLASALAMTVGCEAGYLIGAAAPFSKGAQGRQSMQFLGNSMTSADAASRGRSQIVINNGQPQQQTQFQGRQDRIRTFPFPVYRANRNTDGRVFGPYPSQEEVKGARIFDNPVTGNVKFIICNYACDFNGNGTYDLFDDFVGVKEKFNRDEKVTVYVLTRDLIPAGSLSTIVYNPRGEIIKRFVIDKDSYGSIMPWEPNSLESGNYMVVAKLADGKSVGSIQFEVSK